MRNFFLFIKLYCDKPHGVSLLIYWCFYFYDTNPGIGLLGWNSKCTFWLLADVAGLLSKIAATIYKSISFILIPFSIRCYLFNLIHIFLKSVKTEHVFICLSATWICSSVNFILICFSFVSFRLSSLLKPFLQNFIMHYRYLVFYLSALHFFLNWHMSINLDIFLHKKYFYNICILFLGLERSFQLLGCRVASIFS